MHREMRRKDRQLSDQEMLNILAETIFGVLSTVDEDGNPYGVPVNFVHHEDKIFFHSAPAGHKLDNIKANNRVSFCVVAHAEPVPDAFTTKYKSVIAFGTVTETPEEEKTAAYKRIFEKYSSDFMAEGMEYMKNAGKAARVFQINIDRMTAKGNFGV